MLLPLQDPRSTASFCSITRLIRECDVTISQLKECLLTMVDRGAAFLNEPEGEKFINKLWKESVQDIAAVDPSLSSYA